MAELSEVQQQLLNQVPFNQVLGIQIASLGPEAAEVTMPLAEQLLNHVGTVHAAAQFGLGESAAGAMTLAAFSDVLDAGWVPLVTHAEIHYRQPARGALIATGALSGAEQRRVRAEVDAGGRPRYVVDVQIRDGEETVVATLTIEWALVPRS